jgi:uncharacterized membrane protein YraQ (UPF0718 family)
VAEQQGEGKQGAERGLTFRQVFGGSFIVFGLLAAATGLACYFTLGGEQFLSSLESDLDLFLFLLPRFSAAMLIAAFVQALLPRDKIAKYVSEEAGARAISIATVVGMMTPGGPMTSFPIVRALKEAGTGRSPLIAYVTSWSTMGFQRTLNWEVPLLGADFALLRFVSSLPLPFIAGFFARFWPPGADERGGRDG